MSNTEATASFYISQVCSANGRCVHALSKPGIFGVKHECMQKHPWEVVEALNEDGCNAARIPRSMGRGVVFQEGTMTLTGFVPDGAVNSSSG